MFQKARCFTGTITKLTSSEILVDIGAKTEALVLEKDKRILRSLLSTLKVGDKVNGGNFKSRVRLRQSGGFASKI